MVHLLPYWGQEYCCCCCDWVKGLQRWNSENPISMDILRRRSWILALHVWIHHSDQNNFLGWNVQYKLYIVGASIGESWCLVRWIDQNLSAFLHSGFFAFSKSEFRRSCNYIQLCHYLWMGEDRSNTPLCELIDMWCMW